MNRMAVPVATVGNEFLLPQPKIKAAEEPKAEMKVEASAPAVTMSSEEVLPKAHKDSLGDVHDTPGHRQLHDKLSPAGRLLNFFHQHTFIIVAIALLIIGAAAIKIGANYWTAQHISLAPTASATIKTSAKPISGFNRTIPAAQFPAQLQTITNQPTTLTVGSQTIPVGSDTIKSWLQITTNKQKTEYYIHVNEPAISASLTKLAEQRYVKAPVNQVAVDEDGVSHVIVGGRNGAALSDPNTLKIQAQQVAKTVMDGKGQQFNTPLVSVPFQAVGPAAFGKLLVADINAKKMWAYQNGQQVNSWLISAGKPSTPTPVGQFKVYAKYSVQDMRGNNPDGTPYFQPHVRWVSYFYQGSAVHGVYWHGRDWFGVNNSSHGCIGLPEDEAQWVYNWAPIGTTVIVHT